MVALLTPEAAAMASTLVASIPFSAKRLRAAARTLWCARWLRPRAISNLDLREAPGAENKQDNGHTAQDDQVRYNAKLTAPDESSAQAIHSVGKRVYAREDRENLGKIVQAI